MRQLYDYPQILRRGWWIIVLTTLAVFNLALIAQAYAIPIYKTSTRFLISPGPSLLAQEDREVLRSIEALDKRSIASTFAEIMGSKNIFEPVVQSARIANADSYQVAAVVLPESSALELSVFGPDPYVAAFFANNLGKEAINQIKELYGIYDLTVIDPATTPSSPISPHPVRDLSMALVLGLIFGTVLAILREQFQQSFESLWQHTPNSTVNVYTPLAFQKRLTHELKQEQPEVSLITFASEASRDQLHSQSELSESYRYEKNPTGAAEYYPRIGEIMGDNGGNVPNIQTIQTQVWPCLVEFYQQERGKAYPERNGENLDKAIETITYCIAWFDRLEADQENLRLELIHTQTETVSLKQDMETLRLKLKEQKQEIIQAQEKTTATQNKLAEYQQISHRLKVHLMWSLIPYLIIGVVLGILIGMVIPVVQNLPVLGMIGVFAILLAVGFREITKRVGK